MKRYFPLILLLALGSCNGSGVPQEAVANSGIVGSLREGNSVTIIYQKSSTTDQMLFSEAARACSAVHKTASPQRVDAPLQDSKKIPGVDGKVIFQCV